MTIFWIPASAEKCYTDYERHTCTKGICSTSVKAVNYYSYDDIRLENRYIPTITDNELLVKVHGCGLCGSDILKIVQQAPPPVILGHELDRKSTRLNSSHANISYAVFCLKKKKKN